MTRGLEAWRAEVNYRWGLQGSTPGRPHATPLHHASPDSPSLHGTGSTSQDTCNTMVPASPRHGTSLAMVPASPRLAMVPALPRHGTSLASPWYQPRLAMVPASPAQHSTRVHLAVRPAGLSWVNLGVWDPPALSSLVAAEADHSSDLCLHLPYTWPGPGGLYLPPGPRDLHHTLGDSM